MAEFSQPGQVGEGGSLEGADMIDMPAEGAPVFPGHAGGELAFEVGL